MAKPRKVTVVVEIMISDDQARAWAIRKGFANPDGVYVWRDIEKNVKATVEALVRDSEVAEHSTISAR